MANCTAAKRKKPCFVCGSLEHNAKQCSKVCKRQIEACLGHSVFSEISSSFSFPLCCVREKGGRGDLQRIVGFFVVGRLISCTTNCCHIHHFLVVRLYP